CGDQRVRIGVEPTPIMTAVSDISTSVDTDVRPWLVDLDLDTYIVKRVSTAEVRQFQRSLPRAIRRAFLAGDPEIKEVASPNGTWLLGESGPNLTLRSVNDDKLRILTEDGLEGNAWQVDGCAPWANGATWSRDSRRVAVSRRDTRECSLLPLVS